MMRNFYSIILVVAFILIFYPAESFCLNAAFDSTLDDKSATNNILSLRINRNLSLNDLLTESGYKIEDNDIDFFLKEFLSINKDIKGISNLKKGTIVKLPLRNLKKVSSNLLISKKTSGLKKKKTKLSQLSQKEDVNINAVILKNIKILSRFLDDTITVEEEGFKFFNVNERSEILFDTAFFPLMKLNENKILVIDFKGILPDEIKNIIELSWPEYRIVSNNRQNDFKSVIGNLLESMGYFVSRDQKIITGGSIQFEYLTDFLVFKNSDDFMTSDITFVGIVGIDEYSTPENITEWLRERGINLIELSYNEIKRFQGGNAKIVHIASDKDPKEFTETILSLFGYNYSKNKILNLSGRKEYSYNLKADISFALANRTKVIEFADLNEDEINYGEKRGFDIIYLEPWETRKNILKKIMSLLSLNYKPSSNMNSQHISPKGVKYRLISSGIFVHSIHGPVFLTDSELNNRQFEQLVDEKINIITY